MELFDRQVVFEKVSRSLAQIGCTAMTASAEYRRFLEECLHWADTAPSEKERASFLQLAKTWYEAALREEQSLGLIRRKQRPAGRSAQLMTA